MDYGSSIQQIDSIFLGCKPGFGVGNGENPIVIYVSNSHKEPIFHIQSSYDQEMLLRCFLVTEIMETPLLTLPSSFKCSLVAKQSVLSLSDNYVKR